MKKFHNLSEKFTNWETIALIAIKQILVGKNLRFSRSELMNFSNLENAQKFLIFFGHKELPQKLESTLQRTIQNLRDKGYIQFLAPGEYKLTPNGEVAINSLNSSSLEIWEFVHNISIDKVLKLKNELQNKK